MVLGDIKLTVQAASAQLCADIGYDNQCAAITFIASSSHCDCLSNVKGYTEASDTMTSYMWLNPVPSLCLNTTTQEQLMRDIVYGSLPCPVGFALDMTDNTCFLVTTQYECSKYGIWVLSFNATLTLCKIGRA
ncbi:hypothetical protein AAVH_07432 [Aphelenchoides avenae]|nr:hypothetical protein AAVH_07432 [Aphelenchus avenae]